MNSIVGHQRFTTPASQIFEDGALPSSAKTILTPAEAERAIYFDFEGFKGQPPALLGVTYAEGRFADPERVVVAHYLLHPDLRPLANSVSLNGAYRYDVFATTLPQAVHALIRRAKNQQRPLVSWSQHERLKLDEAALSPYLHGHLDAWYRDGKATAKAWRRVCRPDVNFPFGPNGGANQLTRYVELVGIEVPEEYGKGKTTARLRCVLNAARRGKRFDEMTAVQRGAWIALVGHNYFDCFATREVCRHAASALERGAEYGAR